jgi:hypothetical protein
MAKRKRDYAAEYQRRKQRSLEQYGVPYSTQRRVRQAAKQGYITEHNYQQWRDDLEDRFPDLDPKLLWYHSA